MSNNEDCADVIIKMEEEAKKVQGTEKEDLYRTVAEALYQQLIQKVGVDETITVIARRAQLNRNMDTKKRDELILEGLSNLKAYLRDNVRLQKEAGNVSLAEITQHEIRGVEVAMNNVKTSMRKYI